MSRPWWQRRAPGENFCGAGHSMLRASRYWLLSVLILGSQEWKTEWRRTLCPTYTRVYVQQFSGQCELPFHLQQSPTTQIHTRMRAIHVSQPVTGVGWSWALGAGRVGQSLEPWRTFHMSLWALGGIPGDWGSVSALAEPRGSGREEDGTRAWEDGLGVGRVTTASLL